MAGDHAVARRRPQACVPAGLPAFMVALSSDPVAVVRDEAARRLASWDTPEAMDALARALLDTDAAVRATAAQRASPN